MERTVRVARLAVVALSAWVALVLLARVALQQLVADGRRLRIPFAPLDAFLDWRPSWRLGFALVVGAIGVTWGPRVARRASWRRVLGGATRLGGAWAVALALVDGVHGLVASIGLRTDAGRVRDPPPDAGAKSMVILVTGGAGFVGSFAVDQLVADGHDVRVLDLLHRGAHRQRPEYLNPRAEYVWGDVADVAVARRAVAGVDAVSHQAAMVGARRRLLGRRRVRTSQRPRHGGAVAGPARARFRGATRRGREHGRLRGRRLPLCRARVGAPSAAATR